MYNILVFADEQECNLYVLGRICLVHFEPLCFRKSLQQEMLQYFPVKVHKLRNDAIPTLHLFREKVANTPLLDPEEGMNALLHVDEAHAITNVQMSTVDNQSFEQRIKLSTIQDTSKNTSFLEINSSAAMDFPNNADNIGSM